MAADILVVDDERDIRSLVCGLLEDEGFQTREAANSDDALAEIERRRPNLVLLDIWLQGSTLDGLGILEQIKQNHPNVPVVMMSGHGNIETAVAAIKDGAYDFVEKPFQADRLLFAVNRAIDNARLVRENIQLRQQTLGADLVGTSAVTKDLRHAVERVAPTNSRVLVTGPPGSGKELIARQIHARSGRADGPFVVLNCATLAPERMEAELFGDEAGAGGESRIGLFEEAHGGTLLLDEVGDMPVATQGKIVRVLQEQIFQRTGGSAKIEVDVRVIATTTRDLPTDIEDGRFREDLYYRLNVVPIEVPPLNARREDVPLLAEHFMIRAAAMAGRPPRIIAKDAIAALQSYSWPGNVRELRNVVERLLIMAPGEPEQPIGSNMLPAELVGGDMFASGFRGAAEMLGVPLREARETFERDYLVAQLDRFDGNISRTAEFVGMERSALHRKLKSLGIST